MKGIAKSETGSVVPIFGVSLFAIIALVCAALALGMDSRAANDLQHKADSAALGGAIAFVSSEKPRLKDRLDDAQTQAKALATGNAEIQLTDFEISGVSEDAYGQHLTLEVELGFKPANAAAEAMGRNANVEIKRRAVAGATWGFPLCILTLARQAGGIMMDGNPELTAPDCIAWNNARHRLGVQLDGGQTSVRHMCVVGNGRYQKGRTLIGTFTKSCDPLPDPMRDLVLPDAGSCEWPSDGKAEFRVYAPRRLTRDRRDHPACKADRRSEACRALTDAFLHNQQALETSRARHRTMDDLKALAASDNVDPWFYEDDPVFERVTKTLTPGTYCGIDIAYGHIKMEPGTYFIKGGPMTIRRRARLTAEGVTLIFSEPYAHLRVSDEAAMRLIAPKDGPLAGVAIAETRDTRPPNGVGAMNTRLTGLGELFIVGLIYLPTQDLFFSGAGTGEQTSPLLQIIARRLAMADTAKLKIDFDPVAAGIPVAIAPAREARLIE